MKHLLVIGAALGLAACSNQQMYDTVRGAKQSECRRLEDTHQYSECMKQAEQSYEEYKRAREQLKK